MFNLVPTVQLGVNSPAPGDIKNAPPVTRKRSVTEKKAINNFFPDYQCLQFLLLAFFTTTLRLPRKWPNLMSDGPYFWYPWHGKKDRFPIFFRKKPNMGILVRPKWFLIQKSKTSNETDNDIAPSPLCISKFWVLLDMTLAVAAPVWADFGQLCAV